MVAGCQTPPDAKSSQVPEFKGQLKPGGYGGRSSTVTGKDGGTYSVGLGGDDLLVTAAGTYRLDYSKCRQFLCPKPDGGVPWLGWDDVHFPLGQQYEYTVRGRLVAAQPYPIIYASFVAWTKKGSVPDASGQESRGAGKPAGLSAPQAPTQTPIETAWQDAANKDTLFAYQDFVEKFPGSHTQEIKTRLVRCFRQEVTRALKVEQPEVIKNRPVIPIRLFANGAVTWVGSVFTVEQCVFLGDPTDRIGFQGTPDGIKYIKGTGCVVVDGKQLYLYGVDIFSDSNTGK
jgi:hypothetical protein